ncbi:hypothetical protein NMG60_11035641 [Bertholletia excelsa]
MSHSNQNQPQVAYPAPPPSTGAYMVPPPVGYPTKDAPPVEAQAQQALPKTRSRGDGFWKGWSALSLYIYMD